MLPLNSLSRAGGFPAFRLPEIGILSLHFSGIQKIG